MSEQKKQTTEVAIQATSVSELEKIDISSIDKLQANYQNIGNSYVRMRFANNPEFREMFLKTFADMVFSAKDDFKKSLENMSTSSLLNSVFHATEIGASFARKEITILPFSENKKETVNGVTKVVPTGKLTAVLVVDINFQRQQIMAMPNCKRYFDASVHEGVSVIEDLNTGNYVFDGVNDVSKPTIGYYACFIDNLGYKYDVYMSNELIKDRLIDARGKMYDEKKYEKTEQNIHYAKIVIRNLIKKIPGKTEILSSIMAHDDAFEYVELDGQTSEESPRSNKVDNAKKLAENLGFSEPKNEIALKAEVLTEEQKQLF